MNFGEAFRVHASKLTQRLERGAAAVEFALVAMLLITLVLGAAEFGRMWFTQANVAAAARAGAREMAVKNDTGLAAAAVAKVFPAVDPAKIIVAPTTGCASGLDAEVTVSYDAEFMTGFFDPMFGDSISLTGKGVMRCGG